MFTPSHDAVVLYALEPPLPAEPTDGTPPTLPAHAAPSLLGYTNLPQTARGLNNSKGFAIGQQGAAYNKRGRIEPTASVEIRPGSLEALSHLIPTSGKLPYLAIFVSVKGQGDGDLGYTDVYRYCKPTTLDWKMGGGDKQGGEIKVSAAFWATTYERQAYIPIPTTDLRALGTPLMWHDVRQFSLTDSDGTQNSYRRALMSISAKIDYGLERKNERPNWGDDNPLSRTSYALLEHHVTVSGEIGLHDRLPETLFTSATNAQNWGDIVVGCSDLSATPKKFTLTLSGAFPSDETQGGGESSGEIDHTVPFTADNFLLSF